MTCLWIALSLRKNVVEIRKVLKNLFPDLVIADWDLSSFELAKQALKDPAIDNADVLFHVWYNKSEFPTLIEFDRFPGPKDEAVIQATTIELARLFANAFECRTICEGFSYGDDESPYWDIVWDQGRSYLADDCDTEFGDQTGEPVKIVREISIPRFALDDSGRLIP